MENSKQSIQIDEVTSLDENRKLAEYSEKLENLRRDGINKITALRQQIAAVKRSKMISSADKAKMIAGYRADIEKAKKIAAANKAEDSRLTKEAVEYANALSEKYMQKVQAEEAEKAKKYKKEYLASVKNIQNEGAAKEKEILAETTASKKEDI